MKNNFEHIVRRDLHSRDRTVRIVVRQLGNSLSIARLEHQEEDKVTSVSASGQEKLHSSGLFREYTVNNDSQDAQMRSSLEKINLRRSRAFPFRYSVRRSQ